MSFFSSIGHALGGALGVVGKIGGLIPGVGPLISGAAGGIGKLLDGASLGTALKSGAGDAISNLIPGGGLAGSAAGLLGGLLGGGGGGGGALPSLAAILGGADSISQGNKASSALTNATNMASTVGSLGLNAYNAAQPIRDAAQSALLSELKQGPVALPDLSQVVDRRNPFRKNYGSVAPPRAAAAPTAPVTAPVIPLAPKPPAATSLPVLPRGSAPADLPSLGSQLTGHLGNTGTSAPLSMSDYAAAQRKLVNRPVIATPY